MLVLINFPQICGMKIRLLCIGKTDDRYIQEGIEKYLKRLKHYISFQIVELPDIKNAKNLSEQQQKEREGEMLLKQIGPQDFVMLLDERGKAFRSIEFSAYLEQKMVSNTTQMLFIIGGPYGFSELVQRRANFNMSLSNMTFSHQMIRLFMVEQLYRAYSIMRGEPYHHE